MFKGTGLYAACCLILDIAETYFIAHTTPAAVVISVQTQRSYCPSPPMVPTIMDNINLLRAFMKQEFGSPTLRCLFLIFYSKAALSIRDRLLASLTTSELVMKVEGSQS